MCALLILIYVFEYFIRKSDILEGLFLYTKTYKQIF